MANTSMSPPDGSKIDWICIPASQDSITRELHTIFGAYTTSGHEGSENKS